MIRLSVFLSSILITLLCWLYLTPLASSIKIPYKETFGIISEGVVKGRSPLSNIAMYLILVFVPSLIVLLLNFLASRKSVRTFFNHRISSLSEKTRKIGQQKLLAIGWLGLVGCWIINSYPVPNLDKFKTLVEDGFHFGEKVGLAQTFLSDPQHFFEKGYLLIHGFTLNVLTGTLGILIAGTNKDLAVTGFINDTIFYIIPAIFSFLIVYEVSAYIAPQKRWQVFILLSIIYFACGKGTLFRMTSRDIVFLPQVYLAVRWTRLLSQPEPVNQAQLHRRNLIYAALVGAAVPIGIVGVNDRAAYFIVAVVCLFAGIGLVTGLRHLLKLLGAAIAGVAISCLLLSLVLGFSAVPVSIANILYWSKAGAVFTSLPYPPIKVSVSSEIPIWGNIFLHSLSVTFLLLKLWKYPAASLRHRLAGFLAENSVALFILLLSVFYMRVALTKSDIGHIIPCGFLALFSFIATIGRDFASYFDKPDTETNVRWPVAWAIALILACFVNLQSVAAAIDLSGLAKNATKLLAIGSYENARVLYPPYVEAMNQVKAEVDRQSCFYTLSSEGIWYRMFSKPPCSKYWYFIQAAKPEMQQQLIDQLEQTKPNILLYSSPGDNAQDNIPKETSRLLAHQYVWQFYRPYKQVNQVWFWIRRSPKSTALTDLLVTQSAEIQGEIEQLTKINKLESELSGWLYAPQIQTAEQNLVLLTYNLLSEPDALHLLALEQVSEPRPDIAEKLATKSASSTGWQIRFNRLNLPSEPVKLRAWAYSSIDHKFYEFGQTTSHIVKGKANSL